ncbi:MAG TPA: phytanoyl-CoA dioxygenase family protein [Gaiellales bacterium]|jgi:ectoine hydroxylase|nr:phytanoyl-CoA dioxygenase family protein [Gaiellales bacterium]
MRSSLFGEYEQNGFVFCPELLTAAEVGVLTSDLDEILAAETDGRRVILEADGVTPRTVVNPHLHRDAYARLVRHPALLAAVEELLGEQVYAWQMGVNCKAAFAGDVWFWHQDYPAYLEDDHIPEPRMVNALIFLDEVTALNSPLMLVPGSHRYRDELPEASDQGTSYTFRYSGVETIRQQVAEAGIEVPTGAAGSVIFMNVNTLHGSTANLSPWSRRLITLTFNAFSNKATSPSVRPAHIVPDDRDVPPLTPLGRDCLVA